jgi:hypothetical protein
MLEALDGTMTSSPLCRLMLVSIRLMESRLGSDTGDGTESARERSKGTSVTKADSTKTPDRAGKGGLGVVDLLASTKFVAG